MRNNQATDKISRLLKKRELLAYYVLCKEEIEYNIGEALDTIINELILSKKVAWNILRRLIRLGLLTRTDNVHVKCKEFYSYFDALLQSYRERRARRTGTMWRKR